jgi:peroxiredoxin
MGRFGSWRFLLPLVCASGTAQTLDHVCHAPDAFRTLAARLQDGTLSAKERESKVVTIRQALAEEPDDLFLNRWLIELQPSPRSGALAAEYRGKLDAHPRDLRYEYLYGEALIGKDTRGAIRALQQVTAKDSGFPWSYAALATIYATGSFRDPSKVTEHLRTFHKLCPSSFVAFDHLGIVENSAALRELAGDLRTLLAKTNRAVDVRYYLPLWAAEFRIAGAAESAAAQARVAEDLRRIETLDVGVASVNRVLIEGYSLIGQPDSVQRVTARLATVRPRDPAYEAFQAWEKQQPPRRSPADWKTYSDALYQASGEWIRQWPTNDFVWQKRRESLLGNRRTADDWKQVAEAQKLIYNGDPHSLQFTTAMDWVAAGVLLKESVEMLRGLLDWTETPPAWRSDLFAGTLAGDLEEANRSSFGWAVLISLVDAEIQLKQFDQAHAALNKMRRWLDVDFKKYFESLPAYFPDHEGRYLGLAAKLALAEGRKMDALACYQQMLTNPWYAREYGGPVAHAQSLFKELGGTDAGWAVWSKVQPYPPNAVELPRGMFFRPWHAVNRPLPEFRIPDASGRTWTNADFKGKTTFVWVWATWCGPCRPELPQVQKLFDAVKDRRDVQLVTLSLDENPATAERFLKNQHFSFTTVVAKELVEQILQPQLILGQTWVIDASGSIRLFRQKESLTPQVWVDEALEKLNHPLP